MDTLMSSVTTVTDVANMIPTPVASSANNEYVECQTTSYDQVYALLMEIKQSRKQAEEERKRDQKKLEEERKKDQERLERKIDAISDWYSGKSPLPNTETTAVEEDSTQPEANVSEPLMEIPEAIVDVELLQPAISAEEPVVESSVEFQNQTVVVLTEQDQPTTNKFAEEAQVLVNETPEQVYEFIVEFQNPSIIVVAEEAQSTVNELTEGPNEVKFEISGLQCEVQVFDTKPSLSLFIIHSDVARSKIKIRCKWGVIILYCRVHGEYPLMIIVLYSYRSPWRPTLQQAEAVAASQGPPPLYSSWVNHGS